MSRLISYYGDDFTGSTDVMEALATHGVKTVLFTRVPTHEEFAPYKDHAAIGLAGTSRSQPPVWMDQHLPHAFVWLKSLEARFFHYKVCSTFDSSPNVGSIGRAAEIGSRVFAQAMVPLIVGAPQLKRYTFGGNLFAGYQSEVFRIDRHPVMSRHPVTPMKEADLRLHLAQQTDMPAVLANQQWPTKGIGMLDVHDDATQAEMGKRLLGLHGGFVLGSSGVEYALMTALAAEGKISGRAAFETLPAVPQMVVVSGSVSPTTERQIKYSLQHGFQAVPVHAGKMATNSPEVHASAIAAALGILSAGKSPLIHTALGPSSDEGEKLNAIADARKNIGEGLGTILKAVLERSGLRRAIVAGGDSSSHALGQLDVFALSTRKPLPATPGSPLCTAYSGNSQLNGIEIALKGGQVGGDNYFVALKTGKV